VHAKRSFWRTVHKNSFDCMVPVGPSRELTAGCSELDIKLVTRMIKTGGMRVGLNMEMNGEWGGNGDGM